MTLDEEFTKFQPRHGVGCTCLLCGWQQPTVYWFKCYLQDFASSLRTEKKELRPNFDESTNKLAQVQNCEIRGYNQALSDQEAKIVEELKARGI